ncbi:hypothetical protein [Xaviernesmea oryzae]|nr:hypothetical protein [Xaviernesmea oryzae]
MARSNHRLELEHVPDHVKRDIGILDGREPKRDDPSVWPVWR